MTVSNHYGSKPSGASSSTLDVQTNRAFIPLLAPARYKGAHGGRGSGKSHFFAEMLVDDCLLENGMLAVCIREVQKTLAQSSKRLIESKIAALGVGSGSRFTATRSQRQATASSSFRACATTPRSRSNRWKASGAPGSRRRRISVHEA